MVWLGRYLPSDCSDVISIIEHNSKDDGWDEIEKQFTQHEQSLSQDIGEQFEDSKPAAKQLFKYEATQHSNDDTGASRASTTDNITSQDDEFDSNDEDEMGELDMGRFQPSNSNSSAGNSSFASAQKMQQQNNNKAPASEPVKKKQTLYEAATANNKKRRKSSGSALPTQSNTLTQNYFTEKKDKKSNKRKSPSSGGQTNTLTQHFSSVKKDMSNQSPSTATSSVKQKLDGLVEIRMDGQLEKTSFKKEDNWVGKSLNGFVFTLGDIYLVDIPIPPKRGRRKKSLELERRHVADIAAAWMKIDKTFIGSDQAAVVKSATDIEWVRVTKHELLPDSMQIQLRDLSHRITEDMPNVATSLCYEREGKMEHSFYYQCLNSLLPQNRHIEKPTAVELFAGGGGASIGFERAGINVKWKVDMNKQACDTLQMNFPNSHVFCQDIATFPQSCQDRTVSIYPKNGEVDAAHMSPPCQGMSGVNTSGGANDRQNNECTTKSLAIVECLQPKVTSLENVKGLGEKKGIQYLIEYVAGMLKMGYQVKTCVVNACNFADPQNRKRLIVFGAIKGYKLPVLKPTHGEGKLNIVTAGNALKTLEDVDPTLEARGLVGLPGGGHVFDHYKESTQLSEKADKDYVLNKDYPANTVRKGNQIRHYRHKRYITVRERARIQSFPDSYRFAGSRKDAFDMIGNAVPVKLGCAIGRALMESLKLGPHEMPRDTR